MISEAYIFRQFEARSQEERVNLLQKALNFMQADPSRSNADCLALAMDIPLSPKVTAIEKVDGYTIVLTFHNGESRSIDFRSFLNREQEQEKRLLVDYGLFKKVQLAGGTLSWPEVSLPSKDVDGKEVFHSFDIDPALLYEHGEPE